MEGLVVNPCLIQVKFFKHFLNVKHAIFKNKLTLQILLCTMAQRILALKIMKQ